MSKKNSNKNDELKDKIKQATNLSLFKVKKDNDDKYSEVKRIMFSEDEKLDINVYFKPSKRNDLCTELIELFFKALNDKVNVKSADMIGIGAALIIKYFTSIRTDANDYNSYKEMIYELQDGNYFDKIMESLGENELKVMLDEIGKTMDIATNEINERVDNFMKQRELESVGETEEIVDDEYDIAVVEENE